MSVSACLCLSVRPSVRTYVHAFSALFLYACFMLCYALSTPGHASFQSVCSYGYSTYSKSVHLHASVCLSVCQLSVHVLCYVMHVLRRDMRPCLSVCLNVVTCVRVCLSVCLYVRPSVRTYMHPAALYSGLSVHPSAL